MPITDSTLLLPSRRTLFKARAKPRHRHLPFSFRTLGLPTQEIRIMHHFSPPTSLSSPPRQRRTLSLLSHSPFRFAPLVASTPNFVFVSPLPSLSPALSPTPLSCANDGQDSKDRRRWQSCRGRCEAATIPSPFPTKLVPTSLLPSAQAPATLTYYPPPSLLPPPTTSTVVALLPKLANRNRLCSLCD